MCGFHILGNDTCFFESNKLIKVLDFPLNLVKSFPGKLGFSIKVTDILLGLVQLLFILSV